MRPINKFQFAIGNIRILREMSTSLECRWDRDSFIHLEKCRCNPINVYLHLNPVNGLHIYIYKYSNIYILIKVIVKYYNIYQ